MKNCGFSLPVVSLCAIFPFIPQVWSILRHFSFLLFLVGTEFPAGRMYFGRLRDPPHFGSSAAASKLSSSYSVLCFCLRSQVAVLSIISLASLILLAGFYNSHWFGNEIIPVDNLLSVWTARCSYSSTTSTSCPSTDTTHSAILFLLKPAIPP